MASLVELWETPQAAEIYMLAGWHQWADAGAISSELPEYVIDHFGARKIGEIHDDSFYLFQIPGTHHFLRPEIKLKDGYREGLSRNTNDIYYLGDEQKGLVIFLGTEPHLNIDRYATAFFEAVQAVGAKRVVCVGGVYGSMPYDKDRDVSCTYSLPRLRDEMANYAARFSNYEGGATIGSYLLDEAERAQVELVTFYAFVPAYEFGESASSVQGIRLESDYRAWYELMRRINHMFEIGLDLSELARLSEDLEMSIDAKIAELDRELPELNVRAFMSEITDRFEETAFAPLDDIWEEELGDLFDDGDV